MLSLLITFLGASMGVTKCTKPCCMVSETSGVCCQAKAQEGQACQASVSNENSNHCNCSLKQSHETGQAVISGGSGYDVSLRLLLAVITVSLFPRSHDQTVIHGGTSASPPLVSVVSPLVVPLRL
jgi:hypothetical protein